MKHKSMKYFLTLLCVAALLLAMGGLLSACGGADKENGGTPPAGQETGQ